eukprot:GILK01005898.1.p1 GENE.GILK01005898.1~~GILK01005898.1.p1  ORF type:complete len:325 (-),score=56.67 GILK01005898.1:285-1259(-)
MSSTVSITDIREAQKRIAAHIRRTPLLTLNSFKKPLPDDVFPASTQLHLKLEMLQITGSFKARGAINTLLHAAEKQTDGSLVGLVTASGGNHGLGVAYAAHKLHIPATIYLPSSAPESKLVKLRDDWNATAIRHGSVFDEANAAALEHAARDGLTYVHPFAHVDVIAGQGTIGLELLEDLKQIDVVVVAIGGGGLISGVALAVKNFSPDIKVIGVEPVGAPTLYQSVREGRVVQLESVSTKAGTLAPRQSSQLNLDIIQEHVDDIVLVTDEEMIQAQKYILSECGLVSELAGAAALAAVLTGKVRHHLKENGHVAVVMCSSNVD